jgi:hypothetical protein
VLVWVNGTPQAHLTGDMIVDSISGAKTIEVHAVIFEGSHASRFIGIIS